MSNRSGRLTGDTKPRDRFYLASLARDYTEQAIFLLAAIMNGDKDELAMLGGCKVADLPKYIKIDDRIKAAEILMERGWGKAPQEVKVTKDSTERKELEVTHTVVHARLREGQPVQIPAPVDIDVNGEHAAVAAESSGISDADSRLSTGDRNA